MSANVFYLHGFGSSPASTKAAFFARRLAEHDVRLYCPDLNAPDFERLTVTGMIARVEEAIVASPEAPTVLIGSSLGALVAVQVASRWSRRAAAERGGPVSAHPVERLILLAPALDFLANRQRHLGVEGLEAWKKAGTLEVFHHGEGRSRTVHYGLYEDALAYDTPAARLDCPTLVFHGRRDEVVEPASVEAFARSRPNVRLRMFDDDHQLHASLERIWAETEAFLGLGERA